MANIIDEIKETFRTLDTLDIEEKIKTIKKRVYERDNKTCQWCHKPGSEVHHIIYLSRGGSNSIGNLITLCQTCRREVHENNIEILFDDKGWVFLKPESKILRKLI